MKWNEDTLCIIWNEYSIMFLIDIYQAGLQVLRKLPLIRICLYVFHLLNLLLLGPTLYLSALPALPQLLYLPILQLTLRLLPGLLLLLHLEILRPESCRLNLIGVHMAAHID
jgi:hypothetical protein